MIEEIEEQFRKLEGVVEIHSPGTRNEWISATWETKDGNFALWLLAEVAWIKHLYSVTFSHIVETGLYKINACHFPKDWSAR